MYLGIDTLSESNPFIIMDCTTPIPKIVFASNIVLNTAYNYFGIINPSLTDGQITNFFSQITDSKKTASLVYYINALVDVFSTATDNIYIWLHIRLSSPSNKFDTPRWHTDRYFYGPGTPATSSRPQYKIVCMLTGQPILFKRADNHSDNHADTVTRTESETDSETESDSDSKPSTPTTMNKTYMTVWKKSLSGFDYQNYSTERDAAIRKDIDQALKTYSLYSTCCNQAAIIKTGANGTIYSESKSDSNKIFLSIVTGTREEIYNLANSWGKKFVET